MRVANAPIPLLQLPGTVEAQGHPSPSIGTNWAFALGNVVRDEGRLARERLSARVSCGLGALTFSQSFLDFSSNFSI